MSQPPGTPDPRDPWSAPSGQPQYGPPGYGGYPAFGPYGYLPTNNSKATAALWTGVGALVLTFCCGAGILGLLPIVLGVKARTEIRRGGSQQGGDGMALAGIILGAVSVVLSLAVIALLVVAFAHIDASTGSSSGTRV